MQVRVALLVVCVLFAGCLKSKSDAVPDASDTNPDASDPFEPEDVVGIGALIWNEECVVSTESSFLLKGVYDVTASGQCNASYNVAILLENHQLNENPPGFIGVSPMAVQVTDAVVTLLTSDGSVIDTGALLPNPFRLSTQGTLPPATTANDPGRGVVLVEAIPAVYRQQLSAFGETLPTIVASIELTAVNVSGESVTSAPFDLPIQLCSGCLNVCASDLTPEQIDDLTDGTCRDNAGADGRFCFDDGC
jgi:hypothetical protein